MEAGGDTCQAPPWLGRAHLPSEAKPGAILFTKAGCLICHTYLGDGTSNLGAPDLSKEGTRNRGIQWQIDHLRKPASLVPSSPMPSYGALEEEFLRDIAVFLEASDTPRK